MSWITQDWTTGQLNALVKNLGGENIARGILNGAVKFTVAAQKLLTKLTEVMVGGTEKFVAAAAFGPDNPAGIKFYLWDGFKANFLGKVEENVGTAIIAVHQLEKPSLDAPIMAELGVEKRVIKLAHFYEMLKAQSQGQEGPLLVNGHANIAYTEDENSKVWAVRARWSSGDRDWVVDASSVERPRVWDAGSQVLSPA